MISKILLGVLTGALLVPMGMITGAALLAILAAMLWMSGVHALLRRRAELGRRGAVSHERRVSVQGGVVSPGGNRSPS